MTSSWDSSTTTTTGSFSATETAYSLFASDQSGNVFSPFKVLQDLITTLRTNDVPGPFLLRMETEFTQELGEGAYAEVRAPDEYTQQRFRDARDGGATQALAGAAGLIAVKQHKSRKQGLPTPSEAPSFLASHFKDAMREILALTHPGLRHHPNIVKLMGWGLCLDALENANLDKANIPLLVLERAHGDMSQILQRDRVEGPTIGFHQRWVFCRDIGRGLQALHDNGLTHGDLKTANILVFVTAKGLNAKLCDFGTIHYRMMDQANSDSHSRYRGTPGWRPPEILHPVSDNTTDEQKLIRCDVYTYGLVMWSIMAGHGKSLVQDETLPTIRETAISSVERTLRGSAPSEKILQLTQALSESLQPDPFRRHLRPWSQLLTARERMLVRVANGKRTRLAASMCFCFPSYPAFRSMWQVGDLYERLRNLMSTGRREPLSAHEKIEAYVEFAQSAGFTSVIHAGAIQNSNDDPNSLATLEHPGGQCLSLTEFRQLHNQVSYFLDRDERLLTLRREVTQWKRAVYCYARYRSRIKLCCWRNFPHVENVVDAYLMRRSGYKDFSILAWLCKGEIGLSEVASLTTEACKRGFCDKSIDDSSKLENFLILMQSGLAVESPIANPGQLAYRLHRRASPEHKSMLYKFLNALRSASRDTAMRLVCERFDAVRHLPHIRADTKDFILGQTEPTLENEGDWTALHEFAMEANYEGVKALVAIGANADRYYTIPRSATWPLHGLHHMRLEGKTPLQVAFSGEPSDRVGQLANKRIQAILVSNKGGLPTATESQHARTLSVHNNLPQGWTTSGIYANTPKESRGCCGSMGQMISKARNAGSNRVRAVLKMPERLIPQGRPIGIVYRETFTGSLTFKYPRFSLLTSGRAALGYRNVQDYSLDLLSFLEPPTSTTTKRSIEARFPPIDDDWYRQEPFMTSMTDNPLKDIAESWVSPFSLPRLDFSGVSIPRVQFGISSSTNVAYPFTFAVVSFVIIMVILWNFGPLHLHRS